MGNRINNVEDERAWLVETIAQRIATVAMAAPPEWGSDELWDYVTGDWLFNPLPDGNAREAIGFLDGVAQLSNVLISELIEEMQIDLAGTLALVRSKGARKKKLQASRSTRVAASKDKS